MKKLTILFVFATLILVNCSRDKFEEVDTICIVDPTYEKDIAPIIAQTCAYSGCHDGLKETGYASYEDLEPFLAPSLFEAEVIKERTMPPFYADNGPTTLTEEQYNLMACWVEAGYPKE